MRPCECLVALQGVEVREGHHEEEQDRAHHESVDRWLRGPLFRAVAVARKSEDVLIRACVHVVRGIFRQLAHREGAVVILVEAPHHGSQLAHREQAVVVSVDLCEAARFPVQASLVAVARMAARSVRRW